jgi:hypothetical protein
MGFYFSILTFINGNLAALPYFCLRITLMK